MVGSRLWLIPLAKQVCNSDTQAKHNFSEARSRFGAPNGSIPNSSYDGNIIIMASDTKEKDGWVESVVSIRRCSATVKGGRRFTFNALVVVGDRHGTVGWGYGKANEVPPSVEKGVKDAKKQLRKVLLKGGTIPHQVEGRYGASRVVMLPANPGTGVIAGGAVRAVVQAAGVTDILTKSYGSTNKMNLVKAAIDGLAKLRTKEDIARLRGVEL